MPRIETPSVMPQAPASFAIRFPENRLTSHPMSDANSLGRSGTYPDPSKLALGGGWLTAVAGVLVCGTALLAFLTSSSSAPGVLTVLGVFAALGIFLLFGLIAGHIRLTGRVELSDLIGAVVDEVDHALLVTAPDGSLEFANRAALALLGPHRSAGTVSLDRVFAGEPLANEAYFRLARAIERGVTRTETIDLDQPRASRRGPSCLRVSVRPIRQVEEATGTVGGGLWVIEDITTDRQREARTRESLERRLAVFQGMPAGLLVFDRSGRIEHANPQLVSWLSLAWDPRNRELSLGDLVAGDGGELLLAITAGKDDAPRAVDLDLIQDNGTIWPATVLIRGGDGRLATALVLERVAGEALDRAPGAVSASESFTRFFRSAPFGIAVIAQDRTIESSNAAFSRLLFDTATRRSSDAVSVLTRAANEDARDAVLAAIEDAIAGKANIAPVEITLGEDKAYTRRLFVAPLPRAAGVSGSAVVYVIDATEQRALEVRVAQSQKMEVVGNLAGGIAHDFNNVMTAIIGFADLLLGTTRPGDPAYQNLKQIRASADRAADLVHNLLAFSRQQQLQPKVIQLQELITDVSVMVKRALGENVELKIHSGRDLWFVKADRGELTRVIMNLAVNARDAMPDGGLLSIRTRNVSERETARLAKAGMTPGEYVLVEVEDSGVGMPPEVVEKIFEPFFTTKAIGKGTGLGLSTVYGIVKQTGGFVYPESTPGQGTTFRIYLPRHETADEEITDDDGEEKPLPIDPTGTGRVLVVEDEDYVRSFAVQALTRQGYDVIEASDGVEALEILEEQNYAVDLIVSDVKMPEMDGPTLLSHVRKKSPALKVIFVSGYADDAFSSALANDPHASFLPKPYSLAKIAACVKERLDG